MAKFFERIDAMKEGNGVLFYHSAPTELVEVIRVDIDRIKQYDSASR